MDEMNEDRLADFVDEQLRHLRGEGPAPDLTALDDVDRAEVIRVLDLVSAMADTLPGSPPLDEDAVAIRLGIVMSASSDDGEGSEDAVVAAADEVSYRFAGAIEVHRIPAAGDTRTGVAVMCRSMVEAVLIVVFEATARRPSASDARAIFHDRPELSAIAFSTPDATRAAVVPYSHCVDRLIPADGWSGPVDLVWEPLEISLGRHFERSIPRWEAVATLPAGPALEDIATEARAAVAAELDRVANSRVQLPHKRHARDFVCAVDPDVFVAWIDGVRTRRSPDAQLVADVIDVCRTATP